MDKRFEFVKDFKITVPADYNHATQLKTFAERYKKRLYYYEEDITDANFSRATNKLIPGRVYKVKIFRIKQMVESQDILNFIASQKGILVGAQGASLVYQLAKDQLPIGTGDNWYLSLDKRDALFIDSSGVRVPNLIISSANHYIPSPDYVSFDLVWFKYGFAAGRHILCVCLSRY